MVTRALWRREFVATTSELGHQASSVMLMPTAEALSDIVGTRDGNHGTEIGLQPANQIARVLVFTFLTVLGINDVL